MKNRVPLVSKFVFALAILVSLACGAASQAVSTAAPEGKAGPAATQTSAPTEAPTEAPTLLPELDLSAARISLEELPAGFEEIPMDELGLGEVAAGDDEFKPEVIFAYVNGSDFQMVFGMNFLLTNALDRVGFDFALGQPEITLKEFAGAMGSKNVREEKILEGLEGVGETQIAMTMLADVETIPMRVDVAMFRRDVVGGMIMSMTMEGQTPNITLQELGGLFDKHIQESLNAAE